MSVTNQAPTEPATNPETMMPIVTPARTVEPTVNHIQLPEADVTHDRTPVLAENPEVMSVPIKNPTFRPVPAPRRRNRVVSISPADIQESATKNKTDCDDGKRNCSQSDQSAVQIVSSTDVVPHPSISTVPTALNTVNPLKSEPESQTLR